LFCKVNKISFSVFCQKFRSSFFAAVVVVGWELFAVLSLVGVNILFANGATINCRLVTLIMPQNRIKALNVSPNKIMTNVTE